MSEKSLRNRANHGLLVLAKALPGASGALALERIRKRWCAEYLVIYSLVAGQAKWKSRVLGLWPCEKVFVERHTGAGAPGLDSETWKF